MRSHSGPLRTVLLVGAGHAHLYVAARAAEYRRRGCRLVLIDPGKFWYSGLATGMLGGMMTAAEDQLDPQRLVTEAGGEFIRGQVVAVEGRARQLQLADGRWLPYDYLSLNVGSEVDVSAVAGRHPNVWTVKPVSNLWRLREHLESAFAEGRSPFVAVVGGGPSGCEVAANLLALARRHSSSAPVTLLSGGRLIAAAPKGAARRLRRSLEERGVRIREGERVECSDSSFIETESGHRIPADVVVLATGLKAPRLTGSIALPADPRDGLRVNCSLQSIGDPQVFAVGDCASLEGHPLPKLGVFGVRQAPILHHNLLASAAGQPLETYRPQKRYLSILNLGDGQGLSLWGPFWWTGQSSLRLKNHLDHRFLDQYR